MTSLLHTVRHTLVFGLLITLLGLAPAQAAVNVPSLTSNINELVKQGNALVTSMNATVLNPLTMNTQLSGLRAAR